MIYDLRCCTHKVVARGGIYRRGVMCELILAWPWAAISLFAKIAKSLFCINLCDSSGMARWGAAGEMLAPPAVGEMVDEPADWHGKTGPIKSCKPFHFIELRGNVWGAANLNLRCCGRSAL